MEQVVLEDESSGVKKRVAKNIFSREFRVPLVRTLEDLLTRFSPFERLVVYASTLVLVAATVFMLITINENASVTVPAPGGSLVEGAVGNPRFVNPLLAISQVDQDLSTLIYSGLMRSHDGSLIPDLARDYTVSDDGTTYTFTLRDAAFQDGTPVTAEDVAFTITLDQNPDIRSPRRADWDGVQAEIQDDKTIIFRLPQAYAPFLENTTIGILPKHLWENVAASEFPFFALNTSPIGTGPYEVDSITEDSNGLPTSFTLIPFSDFTLGKAHLSSITFRFYPNEEALLAGFEKGEIQSLAGLSPSLLPDVGDSYVIKHIPSTRIFGIYFNQNHQPLLADSAVREALNTALDRRAIIENVFQGFAEPAYSPLPPSVVSHEAPAETADKLAQVSAILEKDKWTLDEGSHTWIKDGQTLSIAIATADTPELADTANIVAEQWRSMGIDAQVQVYPLAEFSSTVLRPRQYDSALFGQVVGRTVDLFAFWHSSQRNDPGLNLALYTNTKADRLLASARTELNRRHREELYQEFITLLDEDRPALFLYAPEFTYVAPASVLGLSFAPLTTVSERFLNVYDWYTDSETVWSIFEK